MDIEKKYLTVQELEGYTGIKQQHIYRLVERHGIPYVRIGTKMVRFDRTKIDAWMEKQQVKPVKTDAEFFIEPPKVIDRVA